MNLHYITYLKVNTWGAYCNGVFTLVNAHLKRNAVKAFQKIDATVQQGDVFNSGNKCTSPVVDKIVQVSATEFKYEIEP